MKISTVISFCTLDKKFIKPLLEQVKLFCDDIIVVYYDKLLNGKPEPIDEIAETIKNIDSNIKLLCLEFTNGNSKLIFVNSKLEFSEDKSSRYFHNLARWKAKDLAENDYILFIDGDEIPDGPAMKYILDNDLLKNYDGIDFKCYWYFRNAVNQAIQTEECGLLVHKKIITEKLMFTELERWSFRGSSGINYLSSVQLEQGPIFHHFSWVRTKQEMIEKVNSWGHKNDKNWLVHIEEEFSRDFNGTDFVHGYQYKQVNDQFNLES